MNASRDQRCVCGDPIEWLDDPAGPGWIHAPGSDTTCLQARRALGQREAVLDAGKEALLAAAPVREPVIVEEYGQLMSGGSVQVWDLAPELLDIYPLEQRIEHGQRHGGRVLRRRVIVVDDWEEVGKQ